MRARITKKKEFIECLTDFMSDSEGLTQEEIATELEELGIDTAELIRMKDDLLIALKYVYTKLAYPIPDDGTYAKIRDHIRPAILKAEGKEV